MVTVNNQCEYAVYAEVEPRAETHNYLDLNLPLGVFFSYYPDTIEYNQCDSGGVGGDTSKPYIHYGMTSLDGSIYNDIYYRTNVLPLFPENWRDTMLPTSTYHIIYNRELLENTDYSANAMYGCVYVQYMGNGNYVRLDTLNLHFPPEVPDTDEDIFFLYYLGQSIMNNVIVDGLLDLNINGVTFFNLLFGGGFIVFCTWCIVKWIIPL